MAKSGDKYFTLNIVAIKRKLNLILEEATLSYKFISSDVYTLIIFPVTAVGALVGVESLEIILQVLIKSFICGWLYLYIHSVANQDIGFKEDQINKPFRPYPQGLADLHYAKVRLVIIMSAYLAFSYYSAIILPAIVWLSLVIWYNYGNGHKTGFGKLLYFVIGVSIAYYTPWICIIGYFPDKSLLVAHKWFPMIEYVSIVASILQDFRDAEGDSTIGRLTYPIMYGVKCRNIVVFLIFITPLLALLLFYGFFEVKLHLLQLVYWVFLALGCSSLAYRLMYKKDPLSDSLTYTIWCFLCVTFFAIPAFIVAN